MKKTSADLDTILDNLDTKVINNSASITAVVNGFEDKVFKQPIEFKVKNYIVTVDAKGSSSSPDLHLSCTCNYWKYQGSEYHAVQNDYLYGNIRGTAEMPSTKDPNNSHKVCKHVYAVLRDFFGA
tara:strand:+ start:64 stop:438 length:375 start_codon:yes stop_codon:yes gene_type:complete